MKLLAPGDFVIWRGRSICKILFEGKSPSFLPPAPQGALADIQPAGLTVSDWNEIKNSTTRWVVQDENTDKVFTADGMDLVYMNEMQVIALMARLEDTRTEADGLDGQKEERE